MLNRRDVVKEIRFGLSAHLFVTGLGSPSYDLHAAGDSPKHFYLWGAMGGAAMMGLGLAMARPDQKIAVLTGDGEQLMGLGALATIGVAKPQNLAVIVLDNGHFGETGMQQSHTSQGVDLSAVAASCGFAQTCSIEDETGLADLLHQLQTGVGPFCAVVRVSPEPVARSLPMLDGTELKNRFRRALNLDPL